MTLATFLSMVGAMATYIGLYRDQWLSEPSLLSKQVSLTVVFVAVFFAWRGFFQIVDAGLNRVRGLNGETVAHAPEVEHEETE